jgi:hypothetical protein
VALVILLKPLLVEVVDDCHWIDPTDPFSVSTLLFPEAHTVVSPVAVPATVAGLTVILAMLLFTAAHTPLFTTARYQVVAVNPLATSEAPVESVIGLYVILSADDCH